MFVVLLIIYQISQFLAFSASISHTSVVLAMDGSTVGQDCMALMVNVVYQERALRLGYLVVRGKRVI
ncbi:MAG: hypothetical protein HXX08_12915 [Chloroflexi bacterium]|uniref:Uncharacterized protein n=1 Tax=Candidatus Chlorohelix allophototropha TaxID=3003348 RepID=A0A8T7M3Y2_9CHLR|nr:hypothetical protein [Chloroflexota bacterium]NWJ46773.1 hypothetical protein [Chloroflexota bacterium]WJW70243.1 hypothetical protein OZ401_004764 [Chloroflexota bacterium L227-S17]